MNRILRTFIAGFYLFQLAAQPMDGAYDNRYEDIPSITGVTATAEGITIDLTQLMPYDIYTLSSPYRLVVELPGTLYKGNFSKKPLIPPSLGG